MKTVSRILILTATSLKHLILALIKAKNKKKFINAYPLEVQSDG